MTSVRPLSTIPIVALAAVLLGGCGTVFGGKHQTVSVSSSPDNARVSVEPEGQRLRTPTVVELERGREYLVTLSRSGYESREVRVRSKLRPLILVADIVFGVVPVVVDGITGAWNKLEPDEIDVTLARTAPAGSTEGPDRLRVRLDRTDGSAYRVRSDLPVHVSIRVIDSP